MTQTIHADVAIIGGGIAGASLGYWLAPHLKVVVLERESQPGYHSTGRSAAMFIESYGTPQVRALTMASRAFFTQPPPGFADHRLLTPRGILVVASEEQLPCLGGHIEATRSVGKGGPLGPAEALAMVPALNRNAVLGAVYNPDAEDVDVHALHHGYLRGLRQAGATIVNNAQVTAAERGGHDWLLTASNAAYRAGIVVNAAGAWADEVAALFGARALGLQPCRRTAFHFASPPDPRASGWPLVMSADESCYIKPDNGRLLGSPANADPVPAQDVQPDELDIALGIDRIETMTTLKVGRPSHVWAGLRTFAPDGDLVGGYDTTVPGLFWVAGQGGYGIQTSAAMGEACAALVRGLPLTSRLADFGLTEKQLGPRYFSGSSLTLGAHA